MTHTNTYAIINNANGFYLNANKGLLYWSATEGDRFDKANAERAVKILRKKGFDAEAFEFIG